MNFTKKIITYHEHEQQQHQQKQHGFCVCGRCKGPTFEVSWGPLSAEFNGPPCVPVPMPRSRHPVAVGNPDTLQDISDNKIPPKNKTTIDNKLITKN